VHEIFCEKDRPVFFFVQREIFVDQFEDVDVGGVDSVAV
jgi:hypothetical protein